MVRVHKRASKRQSTKQREKVRKKVSEHHRKARRAAKRDPTWRSKKRQDPGIPKSLPFRQQLIDEVQQRRLLAEEEKQQRKRQKLGGSEGEDAEGAATEGGEESTAGGGAVASASSEAHAPLPRSAAPRRVAVREPELYRGTLADLKASLGGRVRAVVFALDARDPEAWRLSQLERDLRTHCAELVVALALTRADLVPAEVVCGWMHWLSKASSAPVFPVASPTSATMAGGSSAPGRAGGVAVLSQYLASKLEGAGGSVVVLGLENAGRTQLARSLSAVLAERKGTAEGDDKDDAKLDVLDTTAIVAAASRTAKLSEGEASEVEREEQLLDEEEEQLGEEELEERAAKQDEQSAVRMLMRNKGSLQRIQDPMPLVHALVSRLAHPSDLMLAYNTPAFGSFVPTQPSASDEAKQSGRQGPTGDYAEARALREKLAKDAEEFLIGVARVRGRQKKHGVPDTLAAARLVLRDWATGEVGYYVAPTRPTSAEERSALSELQTATLEADAGLARLVVPRKQWKASVGVGTREVRLRPLGRGMLEGRLALARPEDEEEQEDEFGDEDEDEDGEEGEEEDEGEDEEDEEEVDGELESEEEDEDTGEDGDPEIPDADPASDDDEDEDEDEEDEDEDEVEDEVEEDGPAIAPSAARATDKSSGPTSILKRTSGADDAGGSTKRKKAARVTIDAAPRSEASRRGGETVGGTGGGETRGARLPLIKRKPGKESPLSRREQRLRRKEEAKKRVEAEAKRREKEAREAR